MTDTIMTDTIINLTPHAITITGCTPPLGDAPAEWSLPPSGTIARACEEVTAADPIAGIPTTRIRYRGAYGLPDPMPGWWYVVSTIAAQAAAESGRATHDLLTPGEQVRDAAGKIIGCRSLCRWDHEIEPPAGYVDRAVERAQREGVI